MEILTCSLTYSLLASVILFTVFSTPGFLSVVLDADIITDVLALCDLVTLESL
jgi:hypothetical protein